jgi:hypothetical protein
VGYSLPPLRDLPGCGSSWLRHHAKSPLRRNQFGFNVAGPVLIPHLIENPKNTFFMFSYEGVRERISRAALPT